MGDELRDGYDPDDYPEGHSPFCHRSCDHSCHDAYDEMMEDLRDR